jgi:hypothetical protein
MTVSEVALILILMDTYPNDIHRLLNEDVTDKIRNYHTDYNSTYGRLHTEFVCLLFLQVHRENDRFFAVSRVQLVV